MTTKKTTSKKPSTTSTPTGTNEPSTDTTSTTSISTVILEQRIKNLEDCIAKMAHMTGQERVINEFGIEKWTPSKNDMKKFKG